MCRDALLHRSHEIQPAFFDLERKAFAFFFIFFLPRPGPERFWYFPWGRAADFAQGKKATEEARSVQVLRLRQKVVETPRVSRPVRAFIRR